MHMHVYLHIVYMYTYVYVDIHVCACTHTYKYNVLKEQSPTTQRANVLPQEEGMIDQREAPFILCFWGLDI